MRLLCVALVMLGLAASGRADTPVAVSRPMNAEARVYFDRGAAHYESGAYAQAIDAFERGRRIDAHPDFLYALAQAHRKRGDCAAAIPLYQAFLATQPPEEEARRAQANLERCPRAAAPLATEPSFAMPPPALATSPPVATPEPPATAEPVGPAWYADVTGGVLMGAGLIGAGVGTTYLVLGELNARRANRPSNDKIEHDHFAALASRDREIGGWTLAAGGALWLGGVIRYAWHGRAARPASRTVGATAQSTGVVAWWGGAF
jgi:tetratricopeptide (TPR) repeat protein